MCTWFVRCGWLFYSPLKKSMMAPPTPAADHTMKATMKRAIAEKIPIVPFAAVLATIPEYVLLAFIV
jgi:hypothetical protein